MSLREAIAALAARRPLLVVTDFDGTLAPIVDDPSEAQAETAALVALTRLATLPATSVAILSGRPLPDLQRLVGSLPGVILIGEHGSDWGEGEPELDSMLIERLILSLGEIAAAAPGTLVEPKRWSVAFHYRKADDDVAERAVERVLDGPAQIPGVRVSRGKKVVELHVTERTKGDALTDLRRRMAAAGVLFIGDDVTDETAFATLEPGDVGVKVGPPDETLAEHRVAGTGDVAEILDMLFEATGGAAYDPDTERGAI
jgi:trehalose 6-phosphate phosphatase